MIRKVTGTSSGRERKLTSIIGKLPITEKQAHQLQIKSHQKISSYLTECCLTSSANVSYDNATKDIERYTGVVVSATTQRRLVPRYQFEDSDCSQQVSEISLDGGKVRLRTEKKGDSCIWRDYKALCIRRIYQAKKLSRQNIKIHLGFFKPLRKY